MPDPGSSAGERMLFEEQERLKKEIEQLREEQKQLREQLSKGDQKNGDKQDQKAVDQKEGDKKDDKKKDEKKEPPKPPLRQRILQWVRAHPITVLLIVMGLVILVGAGWMFWEYLESYESTDDAQVDGHLTQVSSRVNGRVIAVYVENTQSVAAGQTVVDLGPRDYQVALQRAEANLAQAQASIQQQQPNVPITTTSQAT